MAARSEECRLVSGTFAILVQAGLAFAGVATLILKRWCWEKPRRPWLVWFFDVSKQMVSGMLQHGMNMIFGIIFAMDSDASECSWYLVNFAIAVVCGIFILGVFVAVYRRVVERFGLTMLRSGEYGSPPSWRPWLAQLLIWGVLSCVEKLITAVAVIFPLKSHLDALAEWIERPILGHPKTELIIVMVVAPVLLNGLFYIVIDNLIMRRGHGLRFRRHQVADSASSTTAPLPRLARLQAEEMSTAFLGADSLRSVSSSCTSRSGSPVRPLSVQPLFSSSVHDAGL